MTTSLDHRTPNETFSLIVLGLLLVLSIPFIIVFLIAFRLYEAWADSRACKALLSWWFGRRD
jgi:hypothetical protein